MAIDLKKVLAISGQPGLFEYIAQSRTGFIVEAMESKKRSNVPTTAKVTTLADVSIYADDGEVTLKKVLEDMHAELGDKPAPSSKDNPETIKAFFAKVLPGYDRDRFYVSHMKRCWTGTATWRVSAALNSLKRKRRRKKKPLNNGVS